MLTLAISSTSLKTWIMTSAPDTTVLSKSVQCDDGDDLVLAPGGSPLNILRQLFE